MKIRTKLLLGFLALMLLIAGCGTSGGGGGGGGHAIHVSAAGATKAGYRVGTNGAWQQPSDPENFSFNASGAYEVALYCPGSNAYLVYALTANEAQDLYTPCDDPTTVSFDVIYDVSAVSGAANAAVVHKASAGPVFGYGTSGTINLSGALPGTQDLVVVALDNSGQILAAKMLAGVDVQNGQTFNVALGPSDTVSQSGSFPDFSSQVPSGWSGFWAAFAITPAKTRLLAGASSMGGWNYYEFPFATRYTFMAGIYKTSPLQSRVYYTNRAASDGAPGITAGDFPDAVTYSFDKSSGEFSGLVNPAGLTAYSFSLNWSGVTRSDFVSAGYLGSDAAYTLPTLPADMSAGDGYASASGSLQVSYLITNKDLQTLADASRTYKVSWTLQLLDGIEVKAASIEGSF